MTLPLAGPLSSLQEEGVLSPDPAVGASPEAPAAAPEAAEAAAPDEAPAAASPDPLPVDPAQLDRPWGPIRRSKPRARGGVGSSRHCWDPSRAFQRRVDFPSTSSPKRCQPAALPFPSTAAVQGRLLLTAGVEWRRAGVQRGEGMRRGVPTPMRVESRRWACSCGAAVPAG